MRRPILTSLMPLVFGILLAASSTLRAQVVVTTLTDEDDGNLDSANGDGTSLREAINHSPAEACVTFAAPLDIGAVEIQSNTDTYEILAAAWDTDTDGDDSPFGVEFALGTDPAVADPESLQNLQFDFANNDHPNLEFGYNTEAIGKAIWIIERGTDLENWEPIWSSDNPDDGSDFVISGIDEFVNAGTSTDIFDRNISPTTIGDFNSTLTPEIFYRFRADLVD